MKGRNKNQEKTTNTGKEHDTKVEERDKRNKTIKIETHRERTGQNEKERDESGQKNISVANT